MKIEIIETGETVEMDIQQDGISWVDDLLGNNCAFGDASKGLIERYSPDDDSEDVYRANRATVVWWQTVIANIEQVDTLKAEAKELGLWTDALRDEFEACGGNDLEDMTRLQIDLLDQTLGGT